MLHGDGLLLLHLLVLLSLLMGLCHGSLVLWPSRLSHLLLLLEQVWRKINKRTLA